MYCIAQSWENLIFSWKAHNEILFGIQCIDLQRIIVYKRPGKKLKRDSAEYFHFMLCLSGTCSLPNVSSIISTLKWMQNHVSFQIYLFSCWFVFGTSKNVCLGIWFSSVWRVCTPIAWAATYCVNADSRWVSTQVTWWGGRVTIYIIYYIILYIYIILSMRTADG